MRETSKSLRISFFFLQSPYLHKWFVSWTVGKKVLKPLCREMLHWLKLCFRQIHVVGLLYWLALRYCQNKSDLHYIFGSVYNIYQCTHWHCRFLTVLEFHHSVWNDIRLHLVLSTQKLVKHWQSSFEDFEHNQILIWNEICFDIAENIFFKNFIYIIGSSVKSEQQAWSLVIQTAQMSVLCDFMAYFSCY